jgi:ribonuclease HI
MADWLGQFSREFLLKVAPGLAALADASTERELSDSPQALLEDGKVLIYTDGSALDNPGPGGYGVVLRFKNQKKELSGGYRLTTNSRMELMACIEGLKVLKTRCSIVLFSDSSYVVNAITKGWVKRWRGNGWTLSDGGLAKNVDLWQQLAGLCDRHDVEFRWVRGHAGNRENERCDRLAVAAARGSNLAVDEGYERSQTQASPGAS